MSRSRLHQQSSVFGSFPDAGHRRRFVYDPIVCRRSRVPRMADGLTGATVAGRRRRDRFRGSAHVEQSQRRRKLVWRRRNARRLREPRPGNAIDCCPGFQQRSGSPGQRLLQRRRKWRMRPGDDRRQGDRQRGIGPDSRERVGIALTSLRGCPPKTVSAAAPHADGARSSSAVDTAIGPTCGMLAASMDGLPNAVHETSCLGS